MATSPAEKAELIHVLNVSSRLRESYAMHVLGLHDTCEVEELLTLRFWTLLMFFAGC